MKYIDAEKLRSEVERVKETGWWKCIAPTHQMAMGWLRKVHNIHIVIDCGIGQRLVYFVTYEKYNLIT